MNRKIFVVGHGLDYANWCEGVITNKIEEADLVLFTGGEDVDPRFYNEVNRHPYTYSNAYRDVQEKRVFAYAQELGKKMLGICRGSQFLCAMAGGKLVQHQENPAYIHSLKTISGDKVFISSTHHQAMYPWGLPEADYKVLAWTEGMSPIHENGDEKEIVNGIVPGNKECEIVYFKNNPSLNIQGHPEMLFGRDEFEPTIKYCRNLLNIFLNEDKPFE